MKLHILVLLLVCVLVNCENMILGESNGRELVYHTSVQYPAFTQRRRLKYVVYTNLDLKKISGITAMDNLNSLANANVLAGGVGFTFVTIKLKSEKAKGLDYDVKIYS